MLQADHSFAGVMEMIRRQIEWIARAREIAQTRRKLAMLDDERLADLGLTRAEAEFEAARPFWSCGRRARVTSTSRLRFAGAGNRQAQGGRSC